MKYLRYGPVGEEKPALLDDNGRLRDLSDQLNDLSGDNLNPERLAFLGMLNPETLPVVEGSVRIGAPIAGVGKIIAVGLNYDDHARETGMPFPDEPVLFSKAVTALSGPNDSVMLPRGSVKGDWEVELAVVIGRRSQYIDPADAIDCIAGFSVINDVSEREMQLDGTGQWVKGKSFDSFAPLGPWLVTTDEISNPQNLNLWLDLNGQRQQDGNTRTMTFGIRYLLSYISRHMTLLPGDVIATGTPPGVGLGQKPPRFLKPGDVMRLGIEGLGEQQQEVRAFES